MTMLVEFGCINTGPYYYVGPNTSSLIVGSQNEQYYNVNYYNVSAPDRVISTKIISQQKNILQRFPKKKLVFPKTHEVSINNKTDQDLKVRASTKQMWITIGALRNADALELFRRNSARGQLMHVMSKLRRIGVRGVHARQIVALF